MKILVINGPNLNILGHRNPKFYGKISLGLINKNLTKIAIKHNIKLEFFQSNHEGELIDFLQEKSSQATGIIINPGALTHYGYCLRDALEDSKLPVIEVHLSDLDVREPFRKINVLTGVTVKKFKGQKAKSYLKGLEYLIKKIKTQ